MNISLQNNTHKSWRCLLLLWDVVSRTWRCSLFYHLVMNVKLLSMRTLRAQPFKKCAPSLRIREWNLAGPLRARLSSFCTRMRKKSSVCHPYLTHSIPSWSENSEVTLVVCMFNFFRNLFSSFDVYFFPIIIWITCHILHFAYLLFSSAFNLKFDYPSYTSNLIYLICCRSILFRNCLFSTYVSASFRVLSRPLYVFTQLTTSDAILILHRLYSY